MSQDTLSDLLRSVRLRGALFFHVDCVAPWVTATPMAATLAPAVMPDVEHMMEYHVLVAGECWAGLVGEQPILLRKGDVIVFPHGDAHVLSSQPGMRAEPEMSFLFEARPPQLPFMLQQGSAAPPGTQSHIEPALATRVLCGFLGCDRRPFNPLLQTLPRMIHVPATDHSNAASDWVLHFATMAASESRAKRPGGEVVLERMSEMLFVDLLRRYLALLPEDQHSWLAGLRDRHVGRVLSLMHEAPAHAWTLEQLAERAGLSRSALHERFVQFTGLTPMLYLTNWRMQIASRLLIESKVPIAAIAQEAGYDSEAAFSRAFKRAAGVSPSVWRRERGPNALSAALATPR